MIPSKSNINIEFILKKYNSKNTYAHIWYDDDHDDDNDDIN
jgi:hypothetical protein